MTFWMRSRAVGVLLASASALLPGRAARADDPTVATITVTSATAGASFGELVEGKLRFRDREYLLTLRGVDTPVNARGTVTGMSRPREIEGTYEPSGDGLRNKNGVTIRLDPPLKLRTNRLEIEVTAGVQPKNPHGNPGAGVE